jgi:hypothetical protein
MTITRLDDIIHNNVTKDGIFTELTAMPGFIANPGNQNNITVNDFHTRIQNLAHDTDQGPGPIKQILIDNQVLTGPWPSTQPNHPLLTELQPVFLSSASGGALRDTLFIWFYVTISSLDKILDNTKQTTDLINDLKGLITPSDANNIAIGDFNNSINGIFGLGNLRSLLTSHLTSDLTSNRQNALNSLSQIFIQHS